MPTNDERREVAAKLRNITDWECDMCFLEEILAACVGDAYVHYSGCQLDYRLMINGLADLIEPEPERTCKGHRCEETDEWVCHKCGGSLAGYMFNTTRDGFVCVPNFCPSCGEKVVN